jgi:hypothetical protein
MEQVRLAWKGEQHDESERGIRISRFLKEHELVIGRDYTWRLDTAQKEIVFLFANDAQSWASMISMKEL